MTGIGLLQILSLAIFYASYLYFVAAPMSLWLITKHKGQKRYALVAFFMIISILAYARFVEPRLLLTAYRDVELNGCFDHAAKFRVAVFSDIHNGIFGNAVAVERIAKAVNATRPDFVLVPGDYVYFLHPDRIEKTFAAFAEIEAPIYAVLGNHDIGRPGPNLTAPLYEKLPSVGLRMIDDKALRLSSESFDIELIGLSDEWGRRQNLALLENPPMAPRLVVTHHPETIFLFRDPMLADLLIGGHTHGGQIQLPLITCLMTKICGDHAYGLRDESGVLVFTTSGTGMVGLPMRFRVPPRIDVLNVRYNACTKQ